jgi:NRPS condensation-like uncharacterized protein
LTVNINLNDLPKAGVSHDKLNLEDIYTLTPLQLKEVKEYLQSPSQGIFHENLLFNFNGKIDVHLFEFAWKKAVERHAILRTSFYYEDLSKPVQVVWKRVVLPFETLDWSKLPARQQDELITELVENDYNQNYNLEKAPLIRLTLIKTSDTSYKFWWRFHHLLMDGWSFAIVLNDVLTVYRQQYQNNETIQLMSASPFREYVVYLKQRDLYREKLFWGNYLSGFKPMPRMNIGQRSSLKGSTRQNHIVYDISMLYYDIQNYIKEHKITINAFFQGIFHLVCNSFSGKSSDMVSGSLVADRPLVLNNSANMVGPLVNALPIRFQIEPQALFADWVQRLQTTMLEVYQYTSTSEYEMSSFSGNQSLDSFFEAVLVCENTPLPNDPFEGLGFSLKDYQLESRPAYPITVFLWPGKDLKLKVTYDQTRFTKLAMDQFVSQIQVMITKTLNNPNSLIKELME